MYSLPPSPWPRRLPLWCDVEDIRHLEVRRVASLTRVVLVFGCGLNREPCCCLCGGFGLSLFFVAPFSLLAVFSSASAFNQDVSNWNTGAVTTMNLSKCTLSLSLPLCGHGAFRCGVLLDVYDNSCFIGSKISHVLFLFCVCGLGFGLSFLCCTLLSSCSVLFRICVQFRRVEMEYGGGDNYA